MQLVTRELALCKYLERTNFLLKVFGNTRMDDIHFYVTKTTDPEQVDRK